MTADHTYFEDDESECPTVISASCRVHAVVHKTVSVLLNARHTQRHRRKPATVYVVTSYVATAIPVSQLTIQTRFYRPTDF